MQQLTLKAQALWPTTMFTADNPEHGSIKDGLLEFMYAYEGEQSSAVASGVAPRIKQNLFESRFDFFEQPLPEARKLRDFCASVVEESARHMNQGQWRDDFRPEVECHESWFHITRPGGYHDYHIHPNCSWCGIYYVDAGDTANGSGGNSFLDPRANSQSYRDYGCLYLQSSDQFEIVPSEGMLVVFPSYLHHAARPYRGERDRVVVAFNAKIDARRV